MSDETTQNTPMPDTSNPTVSEQVTMPSGVPEASKSPVTPPPVKDDNLSQNPPESQIVEPVQVALDPAEALVDRQIWPESESVSVPETGTAQSAGNEPLEKPVEPIVPESTPVSVPQPKNIIRELFTKAQQAIQFRKRKKLDRVMTLFAKRTNITNDQVVELLHVSDATVTRYLEILEKENKIKQVGKTGKGVSYIKI
ncbi:MAG: iclR-type protein [Patescibacteria group bacterium]|nr:iclR-type protein [Patescibacteria group bacterium]MDQ5968844.1 iclR-type protein [Patescibacteria group bacterium]MDQ5971708.1 iclR-type protein [Patescibacteria group bacterium]